MYTAVEYGRGGGGIDAIVVLFFLRIRFVEEARK